MVSMRMPSCSSPRPATSIDSFSVDSEIAQRDVALRLAQQPLADDAALHFVALGAGERGIVDAEGHRQGRRIDRLRRAAARSPPVRTSVCDDGRLGQAGDGDDVAGEASSIGVRSRPRKASTLVTRPVLDQVAVAVQHLDRLVGLRPSRRRCGR